MPTLTQLQYLVAVDREKHFGRAAKACNVSQPSLSAQVQKVEDILNFIIFDRSKQPIVTTTLGLQFIQQAKVVLREHSRLLDLSGTGESLSGTFRLGVIPTLSPSVIPLFVQSFSQKYPDVDLKITECQTKDIIKLLYDDDLDGGLLVTPLYDDQIIEKPLFYEPFSVFASPKHSYVGLSEISENDLSQEDIWLLTEGHCFRDQVLRLCGGAPGAGVLKNVDLESGSLETIVNLIRLGKGYTLLPSLATNNLSPSERQHQLIPFAEPVPTREVSLVHSREFLKEAIIAALIEEIKSNIPSGLLTTPNPKNSIIDI